MQATAEVQTNPVTHFSLFTAGRVVEFDSIYSDQAVSRELSDMQDEFPRKLAAEWLRRGWTPKQRTWAHFIVWRRDNPQAAPPPPAKVEGLTPIVAMFTQAHCKLKYPKITFELVEPDGRKITVQLSRAGEKSKAPGCINVTDGGKFGQNVYHGRINLDGTTTIANPTIAAFLADFATDPAGKAAEYGKKSGNCCFCNRTLTVDDSLERGYGPVCAKNYGVA